MKELTNQDIKDVSLDILNTIHSFCTNNNIQSGTVEWSRVSLIVYAVTGVMFSMDAVESRDVLFSALSDIIRRA